MLMGRGNLGEQVIVGKVDTEKRERVREKNIVLDIGHKQVTAFEQAHKKFGS